MTLLDWLRGRPSVRRMVEDQVKAGDPPEVRQAYDRLRAAGLSDRDVWRLLVLALKAEMASMRHDGRFFSRPRYAALLARLPDEPGPC